MKNFGEVRHVWSGAVKTRRNWRWGPESHSYQEFLVILQGDFWVTLHEQTHRAGPGQALYYPADTPHTEWAGGGEGIEMFVIRFHWEGYEGPTPTVVRDRLGRMEALASWLAADHNLPTELSATVRHKTLDLLVTEYARLVEATDISLLERTRAFIQATMAESFTLDELARHNQLSRSHFLRLYEKASGGVSPMKDAQRIRMTAARQLALKTELPLKEIAARVGISSSQRLSELMRIHFGMTAQEMRGKMLVSLIQIPRPAGRKVT